MTAWGGKRPGAGRREGAKSVAKNKRRDIAEKARKQGITPLEVMLKAMNSALDEKNLTAAHAFAKDAAPYIHPRLAAVAHSGTDNIAPSEVDDAKLLDIAFGSGARIAPPTIDTKVTH